MTSLLIFTAFVFTIMLCSLFGRAGYLKLPFLYSAVFAGWVLPQLWSIEVQGEFYPGSLDKLVWMSGFCFLSALMGWNLGVRKKFSGSRNLFRQLDERQAWRATLCLSAISLTSAAVLSLNSLGGEDEGLPTGIFTIIHTFSNLKFVTLVLSGIFFLRRRSTFATGLLILHVVAYGEVVLLDFRRRGLVEFGFAVLLSAWCVHRYSMPRTLVMTGLVAASIFTYSVGEFRDIARETGRTPTIDEILAIDYAASSPILDKSASPELYNAAALIHGSDRHGFLLLGTDFWNRFIFRYVPAQFVGADSKMAMMFEEDSSTVLARVGWSVPRGSTWTGIGDAYSNFSYLGALWFAIIGYVVGLFWCRAQHSRGAWDQGFYAAAIIPAVLSIPMYSSYFLDHFSFYVLFILIFGSFWGQRFVKKQPRRLSMPAPAPRSRSSSELN